jgi:archaemetzincin
MRPVLPRRAWLAGVAGAGLVSRLAYAEQAASNNVAVLPMGPFPKDLLEKISAGLRAELGCRVDILVPVALPQSAFYNPRRRYRAEKLLTFLRGSRVPPATKILGVTAVDISTTAHGVHDWGVLGLGQLGGEACVMSTFRCRRAANGDQQVHFRMVTTCIHEVGHTLGLDHCPDARCLMTDARGSVLTVDRTSGRMCARCRGKLGLSA